MIQPLVIQPLHGRSVVFRCLLLCIVASLASGSVANAQSDSGQGPSAGDQSNSDDRSSSGDRPGLSDSSSDSSSAADQTAEAEDTDNDTDNDADADKTAGGFVLLDDVREALFPLFKRIHSAKVTRTTVEMLNDSLVAGREVDSRRGVFQIASESPDKFTIYLKEADRRTRLYCDGESLIAAMTPTDYVDLGGAVDLQSVVTNPPVILGPYPEPVLALSVAGVDPAISFLGGMESLVVADREPFGDSEIPATHLIGVQADGVTWDLWIRRDDQPQPLRLLVDLTPMLLQSGKVNVPGGYSQQIRYDFLSYRTTGKVDKSLFRYQVKPDAVRHDSIGDYYRQVAQAASAHPMLGKPAPAFRASTLEGDIVDTRRLKDKVLVIDFWASWCAPCLEALPMIEEVAGSFGDSVELLVINTGEPRKDVLQFAAEQKMGSGTMLDEEGKIADGFQADRIPQTTIVGADGTITAVLEGFSNREDSGERLRKAIQAALDR